MDTTLLDLRLDVPPLTVGVLATVCLVLVVSDALVGRRDHRALLTRVDADPARAEAARVRLYRRWSAMGWAWAAAALALVALLPGLGPAALGLRLPDLAGLGRRIGADLREDFTGAEALESVGGLVVGLVLGALLIAVVVRLVGRAEREQRDRADRGGRGGAPVVAAAALDPMLPRTGRGRRGWAVLSVTAGVTEEVTYRGLVVLALALLLPSAGVPLVVLAAAVLFGLAHAYQGPAGMVVTGIIGVAFTGLYLATGSLLVPMLAHVLIDLRALSVRPAGRPRVADGLPA